MPERSWARQPSRRWIFGAVRAGWGTALILYPDVLVKVASGRTPTNTSRVVARVLGARQILQAAVTLRWPSRTVRDLGVVTDALHAASGLAFAVPRTPWRRLAFLDSTVAATFATVGAAR
jgi:hypothetical protein